MMLGVVVFNGKIYGVVKIINDPLDRSQIVTLEDAESGEIATMEYRPNEKGKKGWRE